MAAELKPAFTYNFDAEEGNYGAFIDEVRKKVITYCTKTKEGMPVLPQEEKVPTKWFFVVLKTSSSSITLAIRMDNLYLVGFQTPAGVWWEFGKQGDTRLIAGSTWLGFGGRYQDLIGQQELHTVELGYSQMIFAVDTLANHKALVAMVAEEELQADPQAGSKAMLARVVIMVCEGLRFLSVSGTVRTNFFDVVKITIEEGKQVNKWDKISAAVFRGDFSSLKDLDVGIKNETDAKNIVGLVKDQ